MPYTPCSLFTAQLVNLFGSLHARRFPATPLHPSRFPGLRACHGRLGPAGAVRQSAAGPGRGRSRLAAALPGRGVADGDAGHRPDDVALRLPHRDPGGRPVRVPDPAGAGLCAHAAVARLRAVRLWRLARRARRGHECAGGDRRARQRRRADVRFSWPVQRGRLCGRRTDGGHAVAGLEPGRGHGAGRGAGGAVAAGGRAAFPARAGSGRPRRAHLRGAARRRDFYRRAVLCMFSGRGRHPRLERLAADVGAGHGRHPRRPRLRGIRGGDDRRPSHGRPRGGQAGRQAGVAARRLVRRARFLHGRGGHVGAAGAGRVFTGGTGRLERGADPVYGGRQPAGHAGRTGHRRHHHAGVRRHPGRAGRDRFCRACRQPEPGLCGSGLRHAGNCRQRQAGRLRPSLSRLALALAQVMLHQRPVRRQVGHGAVRQLLDHLEFLLRFRVAVPVGHEVHPVRRPAAPHRQLVAQRVRDAGRVGIVAPERVVGALREAVVQLDEVDDALVPRTHHLVVGAGHGRHVAAVREQVADQVGGRFDQADARRFQRFQEAARQAHGCAVLDPVLVAVAHVELELARRQRVAGRADVLAQHLFGAVVAGVAARVHIADAAPLVQADVPGPARFVGGGNRVRGDGRVGPVVRYLHGQRAVDEQHVADGLEAAAQRVADQGGAKARAVDIQVGREHAGLARVDGADRAFPVELHPFHRGLHVAHAQALGMAAEQGGELAGIEVISVVERPREIAVGGALGRARRVGHALLHGGGSGKPGARRGCALQPVGQQFGAAGALAGQAERMEIMVGARRRPLARRAHPVRKLDALLEGGVAGADEFPFLDADGGQRAADRRERAFAHADDADLCRFHQRDLHAVGVRTGADGARQEGGGQPAGRAAANDQHPFDGARRRESRMGGHRLQVSMLGQVACRLQVGVTNKQH
uniref:Uncharacterized protein n=1 Tax=Tanacetum cinerariifolium TaxID=118510 RepID=A0A699GE57_TANCI|nr:hypothetical protein [Tanacetum cinerariifolium]